ncbi:hypothetical protein ACQR1W_20215 [Bradyrhizobium sp. HKCCYLS1011]|uniref:hypothetical protein n=1 Tax=Bradyrhizobium sp. HKCCYLS1011 TaxID=3420733 RepID=UPI003EB951A1
MPQLTPASRRDPRISALALAGLVLASGTRLCSIPRGAIATLPAAIAALSDFYNPFGAGST